MEVMVPTMALVAMLPTVALIAMLPTVALATMVTTMIQLQDTIELMVAEALDTDKVVN